MIRQNCILHEITHIIFAMICKVRISDPCCWLPRVVENWRWLLSSQHRDNNRRAIRWREWYTSEERKTEKNQDLNQRGENLQKFNPCYVPSSGCELVLLELLSRNFIRNRFPVAGVFCCIFPCMIRVPRVPSAGEIIMAPPWENRLIGLIIRYWGQ